MIKAQWPAPAHIQAYTTTRDGGVSQGAFASFNLGTHVGDDIHAVETNRKLLKSKLKLVNEPVWLEQTHSVRVIEAGSAPLLPTGDAAYTRAHNTVCTIMTADCLPLLVCDKIGSVVAAIHAGWRGLLNGVIEETLAALKTPGEELLVWLGPAIGPKVFELGAEVYQQFVVEDVNAKTCFVPCAKSPQTYLADIYALAKQRLKRCNVTHVYGGDFCTYTDKARFFSYRRDQKQTGRMATLIWITDPTSQEA